VSLQSQVTCYSNLRLYRKSTSEASKPAFQPRNVKKVSQYRDRAEERRSGKDNEYAQVCDISLSK
jgi:hypothetical protein